MKIRHIARGAGLVLCVPLVSVAQINAPLSSPPDTNGQPAIRVDPPAPVVPADAVGAAPLSHGAASVPAPQAAPVPGSVAIPGATTRVGDATRDLLALQTDTTRPGTSHQVLGATAGRTWQRYLDSFAHPIPEKFEIEVKNSGSR